MNSKRRRLAVTVSLFALASCASVSSLLLATPKQDVDDVSGVEIEEKEVEGISLSNKRVVKNANGTISTIVNYTITPEDDNYTLTSFMDWSKEKVDTFESPNWGNGIDPANYVTTTFNQSKKEIKFTCVEAFGRTIICSIMTKESPTVKATITLDYMRKELDKGNAVFETTSFQDGEALNVVETEPTYSVGTRTPEKPAPHTIERVYFDEGTNSTMIASYFSYPDLSFAKDQEKLEYFTGSEWEVMKPSDAFDKMMRRTQSYLYNVIASDGKIPFSKEEFLATLTFRKKPNSNADYVYNTHCAQTFIEKYKKAFNEHQAGYAAEVKYNGRITQKVVFDLDLEASTVTNVNLAKENIEF